MLPWISALTILKRANAHLPDPKLLRDAAAELTVTSFWKQISSAYSKIAAKPSLVSQIKSEYIYIATPYRAYYGQVKMKVRV